MSKAGGTAAKPYMGMIKLGPKGQIVIPKEIREMFSLIPGDSMVIMAHPLRGIALERPEVLTRVADAIFEGRGQELCTGEPEDDLTRYAGKIRETVEEREE